MKFLKALTTFVLLLCLLSGCAQKPSAPAAPTLDPTQKGKIQAGIGVEGVRLGMSLAEVEKIWGKPDAVDQFTPTQVFLSYYDKGLEVALAEGKVEAITCHIQEDKEKWKTYPGATSEGLWVGSPRAQFESTLKGGKSFSEAIKYPDLGLRVLFTPSGATSAISVLKPEK